MTQNKLELHMSREHSRNICQTNEPTETSSGFSSVDIHGKIGFKCPPLRKRAAYTYHHISNEVREELVRRVLNGCESQVKVAKDLKINYSTAKSILTTYKSFGRVEKIPHKMRERKKPKLKKGVKAKVNNSKTSEFSVKTEFEMKIEPKIEVKAEPKTEYMETETKMVMLDNSNMLQQSFSQILEKMHIQAQIQKEMELIEVQKKLYLYSGAARSVNSNYLMNQYRIQQNMQQIQQQRLQQQQLKNNLLCMNQSMTSLALNNHLNLQPNYLPFRFF